MSSRAARYIDLEGKHVSNCLLKRLYSSIWNPLDYALHLPQAPGRRDGGQGLAEPIDRPGRVELAAGEVQLTLLVFRRG